MSHPDPTHDQEYERIDDNPHSPLRERKTAIAKSMSRHRSKVGREALNHSPWEHERQMNHLRQTMKGIVRKFKK